MKLPPYGVVTGAIIATGAAYAGVIKSESVFATVQDDRAFVMSLVLILLTFVDAAYRRPKLEFAGMCMLVAGLPFISRHLANDWTHDQALVPDDCFALGDGTVGILIGAGTMLIGYLSQRDVPWFQADDGSGT